MPTQWRKVTIQSNSEQASAIAELLERASALAISMQDAGDTPVFQTVPGETPLWPAVQIDALFAEEANIDAIMAVVEMQHPAASPLQYCQQLVEDRDWVRLTQQFYQPQSFGNLWICPAWHNAEALTGKVVRIDPGLAFGTGQHATTALCLHWLADNPPNNLTVIDYGCGSGILALAALACGARRVIACDHDPQAIEASQNNAALNSFANSESFQAVMPEQMPSLNAPVVIANILAEPLISLAPTLESLCAPGGKLILSGLLQSDIKKVASAYANAFTHEQSRTREEWALMELTRKPAAR